MLSAHKLFNNKYLGLSLAILLWFVILSQRIGISISHYQFSLGLIVFYIFIFFWAITNNLFVSRKNLVFFLIASTGILIASLISSYYTGLFSVTSLLLLIGIYLPTVFNLDSKLQSSIFKHFQIIMLVLAVVGIIQFFSQFVGISFRDWMGFIPQNDIFQNYAYKNAVQLGSNLYKANGVIFSEPSLFSQFIALAILIEIYYFQKYWRLFILLPALLVTFSGTGLILLIVGLLPLVFALGVRKSLLVGAIGIFFLVMFAYSGLISYTLNRITEFTNPNASGYIRFVSPFTSYQYFYSKEGSTAKFWFGVGPGVSEEYPWKTTTYLNPLMKLLVEYGILGSLFFLYLVYIFFSGRPFWLSLSTFVMFSLLSGSLLTPQHLVILYVITLIYGKARLEDRNIKIEEISPPPR